MAILIKFQCPECGGSSYNDIDPVTRKIEPTMRFCTGNGKLGLIERSCSFNWAITDNWRYFIVEINFPSDKAYQMGLKLKQSGNVIDFLKGYLTSP